MLFRSRPSGGFTPDMINFANSTDVYKDWADMVTYDSIRSREGAEKYYCVSVGLRDNRNYIHNQEDIHREYSDHIVLEQRLPDVLATAMGENLYLARFSKKKDLDEFIRFLTDENA